MTTDYQAQITELQTAQSALLRKQLDAETASKAELAAKERSQLNLHAHIGRTLQRDLALGRVKPAIAQAFIATEPALDRSMLYVELAQQVLSTPLYGFEITRQGYEFAGQEVRSLAELTDALKRHIGDRPALLQGSYWLDSLLYAIATDEKDPVSYALANTQREQPADLTLDDLFYLQSLTGEGPLGN